MLLPEIWIRISLVLWKEPRSGLTPNLVTPLGQLPLNFSFLCKVGVVPVCNLNRLSPRAEVTGMRGVPW